ncbi:nucleotidyltransferase family protein [Thermodesulfobacteriota bacterium]
MKAFLLAAGKGTRLKPYTNSMPKCLIPIHGKPMLEIWLALMERCGISEILINTHHLPTQIEQFVRSRKNRFNIKLTVTYEPYLLGSGGTVAANKEFVAGSEDFIIAYADNLTNLDLGQMIKFHHYHCKSRRGVLTMGLFDAPDPRSCGIAVLDKNKKVLKFIEKPQIPESNLANGGIYIASQEIFQYFPEKIWNKMKGEREQTLDFGFDILPALVGRIYGYHIREYLRDIGTVESYHQAIKEWPPKI